MRCTLCQNREVTGPGWSAPLCRDHYEQYRTWLWTSRDKEYPTASNWIRVLRRNNIHSFVCRVAAIYPTL